MARRKKKAGAKAPTTSQKIECKLRSIREFENVLPDWNPDKKKLGRYSGSYRNAVPKKNHAVLVYVDGDFEIYAQQGFSDEDIAWACINFLNTPPPRKKYAKRTPKPPYGNLSLVKFFCEKGEKNKMFFEMVIATEQKKNRHFWGSGC